MAGVSGIPKKNAISFIRRQTPVQAPVAKKVEAFQSFHVGGNSVQLPVGEKPLVIGRRSKSDLNVPHLSVSGRHAEIRKTDGQLSVRDLGSTNGTYVDGQLLVGEQWKPLHGHSQISLGRDPTNLITLGGPAPKVADSQVEATSEQGGKVALPAEGSEFIWGRDTRSDHSFSDPNVSRKHLAIRKNAGAYWVKDLGSSNGTYLGESKEALQPNKWFEVKDQTLRMGDQTLRIGPKAAPPTATPVATPAPAPRLPEAKSASSLKPMSPEQSSSVLSRARVAASEMGRSSGATDLTPEYLAAEGFQPQSTVELGESKIHVSKPYRHEGRTCAVGYVEQKDGSVHVRSLYRSGSHGLWKVASHAGRDGWFGKGDGQESVTLPLAAQEALGQVKTGGEDSPQGNQLFYGALEISGLMPPKSFLEGGEGTSLDIPRSEKKYPEPTEHILTNPNQRPNFSKPGRTFTMQGEVQGEVRASVYPSRDGNHEFMFCQDEKGRAWLGGVFSTNPEVNSFGASKEWVQAKRITSPAVEYLGSHACTYLGEHVKDEYYDYSNYTHKIPVVSEFLKSQRK